MSQISESSSVYLNNPKAQFAFSVRWQEAVVIAADTSATATAAAATSTTTAATALLTLHGDLKHVVRSVVGGDWASLSDGQISLRPLCGGISNLLFLLETSAFTSSSNAVIVRLFGEGSEAIIDRDRENSIIAAFSKLGLLSPTFYGLFENGRIEGFFKGTRSLEPEEMYHPHLKPRIAAALASFNSVDLSRDISNNVLCFSDTENFFGISSSVRFKDEAKQKSLDSLNVFTDILGEYRSSKAAIEAKIKEIDSKPFDTCTFKELGMKFAFERVVSHNDLLSGNILMDTSLKSISLNRSSNGGGSCEKTVFTPIASSSASSSLPLTSSVDVDLSGIILIDFEYAGYNYRGYDVSNHFNEYAGFDFDIEGLFPKKNQRMDFYAYYIYSMISSTTSLSGEERASSESRSKSKSMALNAAVERGLQPPVISTDPLTGDFTITYHPELTSSLPPSGDPLADFMQGFDEATISFSTLPNLYWGTWAIYKASNSAIDFDYIEYATKRFGGYFFIKKLQQEMGI